MENALEIIGLTKEYSDFKLGPLMLALPKGRAMGFVGNNGAGKTTTILTVAGMLVSDEGEIEILGKRIKSSDFEWKNDIGYVGDSGGFYDMWSVEKNLQFFSKFFKNWSTDYATKLADRLELPLNKKVMQLSTGNKMKLKIVVALAHQPQLLLLDEPASGLDPVARTEFMDILFEFMEDENHSMLYSTHVISEISRLCDEFTFIKDGKITQLAIKDDLLNQWKTLIIPTDEFNRNIPAVEHFEQDGRISKIISSNADATINALIDMNIRIEQKFDMSIEDIAYYILKRK